MVQIYTSGSEFYNFDRKKIDVGDMDDTTRGDE